MKLEKKGQISDIAPATTEKQGSVHANKISVNKDSKTESPTATF